MLSGLGFNLEYKFNSGHPFILSGGGMGQRAADEGALLEDARSREPLEPIGSSTTPGNIIQTKLITTYLLVVLQ